MDKKRYKTLRKGTKVYIVYLDDYCDCPCCDGSCAEVTFMDGVVVDKFDAEETIAIDLVGDGHYRYWEREIVYTVRKEAEKKMRELEKEIIW